MVSKTKDTAPASGAFELTDEQIEQLKPKTGRVPKPSVYLAEVATAMKTGKAMGIHTTATVKGPYILGQLRKAEKELGCKLKKWNREEKGYVGFQVVKDDEDEDSSVTDEK